ncbi:MAG TPA: SDR family NAD(P)-dependent oxidoreductase [Spirochaetota bacterium]|nr:SDR family NAD(P)-dependent oxidoreductase [Spirochaetota bacterium]HPV99057.1 SDR family NAD(P)-dependent oxidoreductase [Spirochaetota bacterium]
MKERTPVVLITGCSSGIGLALARAFANAGCEIVATARKPEAIGDIRTEKLLKMRLDITDPNSIQECVKELERRGKQVDILVNNAGYGLMGPLIEISLDELRRQFETNVFGSFSLTQALAEGMIERRSGMIVNIGSVSGVLPSTFAGAYSASKAALNALSDILRVELAPFGVRVITAQPGAIRSNFGKAAATILEGRKGKQSHYQPIAQFVEGRAEYSQRNPTDADLFARKMVKKILAKKPPAIIRIGKESVKLPLVKWLLPTSVVDRILSKTFGLDRLG